MAQSQRGGGGNNESTGSLDSLQVDNILSHPVVQVSWKDAQSYAQWAMKRLLTEAEWEKTARSDKVLIYPWGNQYLEKMCNNGEDGPNNITPVGFFEKDISPYGCYDIAGNVAEWCADFFDHSYYQESITNNPKGPPTGTSRVIRGGSWITFSPEQLQLSVRKEGPPGKIKLPFKDNTQFWADYLGFRCAKDVVWLK
ncbi:MAG: SUMF1/EgtB/PvdO family nonheme iron enzyme [Planctomycetota bacterium]|nr:SUMF1/EgtB/PvdO family nonheme iron enzyme [Planctomycetota bacterium]